MNNISTTGIPDTIDFNSVIDNLNLKVGETVFDEDGTGKIKQIQFLWNYDPIFTGIADKIKPIAELLTGTTNLKLLNMQLFEKHPGISKPTRSHQDNAYFKMTPLTPLTFWLSLDDIDEENGALYYAPKTSTLSSAYNIQDKIGYSWVIFVPS